MQMKSILCCALLALLYAHPALGQHGFDEYSKVSAAEERAYLDNFGINLIRDSNMIGYLAFQISRRESLASVKRRVEKNKRYLVHRFEIPAKRIRLIYLGEA